MGDDEATNQIATVEFVAQRVKTTFPSADNAKFDKAFYTEAKLEAISEFAGEGGTALIVTADLKVQVGMPKKLPKGKIVAFVRLSPSGSLDEKDLKKISNAVQTIELFGGEGGSGSGSGPVQNLELVANEVFLPIMSNKHNQARWGEVATRETMDHFYLFLSSSTIMCGQINGETRLPMPPIDTQAPATGAAGYDATAKNRIPLLEGAIITWTKQIKAVLKQDPESLLKQGEHPTPDFEILFWKQKATNLNSIFDQLQSQQIRSVLKRLDEAKSTYCTTFSRLCKEVFTHRVEANDNMKYLRTLNDWFKRLNDTDDFANLGELFKPIMHIILLIWKNSKHYNSPARLVVLMHEICNSLIMQACKFVSGKTIFENIENEETDKAVEGLKTTLSVLTAFKETYFDYKATAFAECPANPWRIQNNALFIRLDSFLERCHDILDLTQTIVQFTKLAKIEVGGTKGKQLTLATQQIHSDFQKAVTLFKGVPYDIMDVSAKKFDDDFYTFRCSIKELERRIGEVISLAFDDCPTVYGKFKLFDSFEALLQRPILQDELEKKYIALVHSCTSDLKIVQELYLLHREDPPIAFNLPPIAGALTWCTGLAGRIEKSMAKLMALDRAILEREEAKEVVKMHHNITASLKEYENQKVEEWSRDVEASSQAKLKLPLLMRDPETRLLNVNFDPALERLLREVKYFLLLGFEVPPSALEIYEQVEIFRKWNGNLDLIVNMNNDVLVQLLPVEKPLVQPYLDRFDRAVEKGIATLNWKSTGITEFITDCKEQVEAVNEIVTTMKGNLTKVHAIMEDWKKSLVERKPRPVDREEFDRMHKALKSQRYTAIKEGGKEIHATMKETNKVLRVSNASLDWRSYVEFVNDIVVDGLSAVVVTSLTYLHEQLDPESIVANGKLPMVEITLDLAQDAVSFVPSLKPGSGKSVRDLITNCIGSFFTVSTLFKRLDQPEGTYMREMHTDFDITLVMAMIEDTLVVTEGKCADLKQTYEQFEHLWSTDMETYFADFCADAQYSTDLSTFLDLKKFDEAISKYEALEQKVKEMSATNDIGWLRIDTRPIQTQLVKLTSQWADMFSQYMLKTMQTKLQDLEEFMTTVSVGLDLEVPAEAGKEELMNVMGDIRDVRKAMDSTEEMWAPLAELQGVLRKHNVDIMVATVKHGGKKTNVVDYLEESPMAWQAVVKKTFQRKEQILPLQLAEQDALKIQLEAFFLTMRAFRTSFREKAPFKFTGTASGPGGAYEQMDAFAVELTAMEAQVARFNEHEELFELQQSKYPETHDTRSEIRLLKSLWDFKDMVAMEYADWRLGLWSTIDTDKLESKNQLLLKQLRNAGAESPVLKQWDVYRDIEGSIKNMGIVLPLVNELHHPAMRARHWKALAKCTNVESLAPSDPKFNLNDILELQLHEHVDDVSDIVETAQKELKIETKLKMISDAWAAFELEYVPHKDTELMVMKAPEEVIESLDAHQLELQTMIGMGKFVAFFGDQVGKWQETLGTVQETLKGWETVSRNWSSLESIFLASADIRSQLPDDTKRFEDINSEFKELMKEAVTEPNAVEACVVDGREQALKSMKDRLDMCQKSLNEYLDVKKRIFPRFYFVSSVALLDMLANGTNPPKVMRYLSDCYDALSNLKFITLEDGTTSPYEADFMIASDGEQMPMSEVFSMKGEVENYLNLLTDAMQDTLKYKMAEGMETAAQWDVDKELPRHKWLFNYPAQIVLTGTMIAWTEETEVALEEFEGGQEDSVKRYLGVCVERLSNLVALVLGQLSKADRCKIIALITMDVHGRDVVQKLIDTKTDGPGAFLWQQQLRFYHNPANLDTDIKICDFKTKYFYEWVGNTGRLVITPLTDRCYITLTTGLRLFLGGAPAGPAGTGKTETTKDLARALALPCYVFNCSDQMNYQTMADIFRGLAQSGGWGCFDEFNRIPIEVLSVVATQVKTVQDAIVRFSVVANRDPAYQTVPAGLPPTKVGMFEFFGTEISLIPTCGFWITMNPGYAGRTELPENLKALFRSCAMIRPDLKPICENMLLSEGFQTAKVLAIKFVTLYQLSSELLSKQPHYDWGLRAVKSVLRVAGSMKRAEPDLDEAQVLMRALRDFNTPKIPAHDTPVFLRLINDLFMGLTVETKIDDGLKTRIVTVAKREGLQYDDIFVLKTAQYQELLDVRHSVMLLGPTGCAKTTIWKTLAGTHNLDPVTLEPKPKKTCVYETVNPKSVTGNELYGYMTLAKDWRDGVLSILMRGMAKNFPEQGYHEYQTYKWVVLDGDIDAVWIESMNTVMDDNKVLTLVSNERVPLSDAMRMVFEINSLKNATPATVSRAGILYINEGDIGWRPLMESWVQRREHTAEKSYLPGFFDKYVEGLAEMVRKGYKEVTDIRIISKVALIIYLMEALLDKMTPEQKTPEEMELYFIYAATWAFGGPMVSDKTMDLRKKFSDDFASTFGQRYPKEGTCFDYFYDHEVKAHRHWSEKVPVYAPLPIGTGPSDMSFNSVNVATVDSVRMTYLIDQLARRGKYVMLVGTAGTGKTALISEYLGSLDKDADGLLSTNVVMSYYTDSLALQGELDLSIDKRAGRMFGPPATKKLIYFIDDMNLPYVEEYGTQNSIALVTQLMQHGTIFDREDLGFKKEIVDTQYLAAMNPTAGSFQVCERCQRHFSTFAALMPSLTDLQTIYGSILAGHLLGFPSAVAALATVLPELTVQLFQKVEQRFLPSAVKFTYNWNMREFSAIFQGLCLSRVGDYQKPLNLLKLWMFECERVFTDRMISQSEIAEYTAFITEIIAKPLKDHSADMLAVPNLFAAFTRNDKSYVAVETLEEMRKCLELKLLEYNESNAMMDLVLFGAAMEHVARICRIISNPAGNAMLIGVGGSGKQSLTRLAASIMGYRTEQLPITGKYTVDDLREALKIIYKKAAGKGEPTVLLMTDGQIVNDKFLPFLNGLLSAGWIADLFPKDEVDGLLGMIGSDAKAAGVPDNPISRFNFLVKRAKQNLKIALAFSPVGDTFRIRARRFPGLINSTSIDFFHPWPRDALESVALKFLEDVELEQQHKESLSKHMALQHLTVTDKSTALFELQRRYNYVTPKSFLELIGFYKFLLGGKRKDVQRNMDRLDVGLSKLRQTAQDVAELKKDLEHTLEVVAVKVEATNKLIADTGVIEEDAKVQKDAAAAVAESAGKVSAEAAAIQLNANEELSAAEPAMQAAADAVDVLSKAMLTELKALAKPPAGVDLVTGACLILVEHEYKNHKWDRAKKMMANVEAFKQKLCDYDGATMSEEDVKKLAPIIENPDFTIENMQKKSAAAANLCTWVVNIYAYNRIYVKVKPLMDSLAAANEAKAAADAQLKGAQETVAAVEAKLAVLAEKLAKAVADKDEVEADAKACLDKLGLAERLVGGLASENERWGNDIEKLKSSSQSLIGDCMISAGFVSYVGAFDIAWRTQLWKDTWLPDLTERQVPMSEVIDPMTTLVSEAQSNTMVSQGLPADRVSLENGAIILQAKRWPLIIDPQVQGIKWLRGKEKDNGLAVIQLSQKTWIKSLEHAISEGHSVIIENLGQEIDATLDPVLARSIYKKGRSLFINFGGEELEYDPSFALYMQTKLANPHYKPEIAAQCTLINFTATEKGLEDQLLAKTVGKERPDLEEKMSTLQDDFVRYAQQLFQLEDDLLERLANAPDDILSDVALIEGLEATKKASKEIGEAVVIGRVTEVEIAEAREAYRTQASEGAMLYFLLTNLCTVDHMYQYSLDSFTTFFLKSIDKAVAADKLPARVENLVSSLRMTIFTWVARGLFERHKLIFLSQLTFNLMKRGTLGEDAAMNDVHFNFLVRGPRTLGVENPLDWLPDSAWQACQALCGLEEFGKFSSDLVEAAPRFREWYNHVSPESEKLPLDWSSLDRTPFLKMLVVRCLRPDRMTVSLGTFIRGVLPNGQEYADCDSTLNSLGVLESSLQDSTSTTPIYFILSPGANVVGDLDQVADKEGFEKGVSYFNVSMGQGQDIIAMNYLESAHRNGYWVILNNIHLMPAWLLELEKKLDVFALEGSHDSFRLFLTSDPSSGIPIGVLNRCIKLTNEPPAGLKANLKRAFCTFPKEQIEEADAKTKSILFGLCHFHAVMMERKSFGPMGYNMMYPFAAGDLRDSAQCLYNYLESSGGGKIPWEDLKYIFGEIMYGGHIVNDFDRLLCGSYLDFFMKDELLDETEMMPFAEDEKGVSFMSPAPTSYEKYIEHIDEKFGADTPIAFGLHPNAEIDFRTQQSDTMFSTLLSLQPRDAASSDEATQSPQQVAEIVTNDILEKFGEKRFDVEDIARSLDEQGPYQNVFLQEMEVMNVLLTEMVRSLKELQLGFAGELTMSDAMEGMMDALYLDKQPASWKKRSWPSLRPLAGWMADFTLRLTQLEEWANNPIDIPKVTWVSGLVNPQSFITAICQVAAQKNQWELDKLVTFTDVTKKVLVEEVDGLSRDGAYINGLSMQGARWDMNASSVDKSQPKEMFCKMPVMNVRGVAADKVDTKGLYSCPTYKTESRGPTYVFSAQLKTKSPAARWIMAGVALIQDVV